MVTRKGIKIHACMTSQGFPVAIIVSPGNEHDGERFVEVMDIKINNGVVEGLNKKIKTDFKRSCGLKTENKGIR